MADFSAVKQQTFAATMLTLLTETSGAKLVDFCEKEMNVEGASHSFYRIKSSTTSNSINYYDPTQGDTAGDTVKVVVEPHFVYSHTMIPEGELAVTKVDLKSGLANSFKRAVERKEDATVVAAIAAQDANLTVKGDSTVALEAQFDDLIKAIAYTKALVQTNDDHGNDLAVIINQKDYAALFAADKFTSNDFVSISDAGTNLAGGLLVPVPDETLASGTTYIVPRNTVCFASFKNGAKAVMDYKSENDSYLVWARKSVGAGLGDDDASSVIKFESLAVTKAAGTAKLTKKK
jgi:hypothetical protein